MLVCCIVLLSSSIFGELEPNWDVPKNELGVFYVQPLWNHFWTLPRTKPPIDADAGQTWYFSVPIAVSYFILCFVSPPPLDFCFKSCHVRFLNFMRSDFFWQLRLQASHEDLCFFNRRGRKRWVGGCGVGLFFGALLVSVLFISRWRTVQNYGDKVHYTCLQKWAGMCMPRDRLGISWCLH